MSRPDTAAYAIEVRALSKSYGGKLVIDDLSFVVEPGTVTGFLGPNGSGKSTTMRLIVGLDRPSAGTALIGGVEYAQLPPTTHGRHLAGFRGRPPGPDRIRPLVVSGSNSTYPGHTHHRRTEAGRSTRRQWRRAFCT